MLLLMAPWLHGHAQAADENGFIKIFNGKDLHGWAGDPQYWRVEDGALVGEVTPANLLQRNSFIVWQGGVTENFELKVAYWVSAHGNSGINYRSVTMDSLPYAMCGYQADIDGEDQWSGQNYEERGRTFLARRGQRVEVTPSGELAVTEIASPASLQASIRKEDWNEYHLVVKGNRLQHYINGVLMSEVIDNDRKRRSFRGQLGVQVHVGPPMKIAFRDFRFKPLPPGQ